MNSFYSPESSVESTASPDWPQHSRQTPAVPISVYRELATELKATQALVDSLTQQNQQLGQQNQQLRQEMLKFAESAAQLKQAVESSPLFSLELGGAAVRLNTADSQPGLSALSAPSVVAAPNPIAPEAETSIAPKEGVGHLTSQFTQILKPKPKAAQKMVGAKPIPKAAAKRPQPPKSTAPQMLYTEERLGPDRPGQVREKNPDLSGLWLATTIVLIVVSAFGAGFLVMKPLLNNAR